MFREESNSIGAPRGFSLGPLISTQKDEKSIIHLFSYLFSKCSPSTSLVGVSSAQAPLSLSEVCVLAGEDDKQENVVLDTNICVVFVAYRVYLCILPQS